MMKSMTKMMMAAAAAFALVAGFAGCASTPETRAAGRHQRLAQREVVSQPIEQPAVEQAPPTIDEQAAAMGITFAAGLSDDDKQNFVNQVRAAQANGTMGPHGELLPPIQRIVIMNQ